MDATVNRRSLVISGMASVVLSGRARARVGPKPRYKVKLVTKTFTNPSRLSINAGIRIEPVPYPSRITVPGFAHANVRRVQVTLHGLTHQAPSDVYLLLIAPTGRHTLLLGAVGGRDPVADLEIILSNNAATPLPELVPPAWESGVYRPANYGEPIIFPTLARLGPVGRADLSVFNGVAAKGVWKLYARDVNNYFWFGEISLGWSLRITARVKYRVR